MNKSTIEVGQAGTKDQQSTTVDNQQVSQPNANTNVVGSLVGQREIKFRAWLIPDDDFESESPYMTYDLAFEDYAPVNEQLKSVPTLMQFTGLKDKNGKEIYEGDLCLIFTDEPTQVVFENGAFGYLDSSGYFISFAQNTWFFWDSNSQTKEIEIVGNIFESPELLETLR